MASRIGQLRNAAKKLIDDWWEARWAAEDEVVSDYEFEIDSKTHKGRKVYIVPATGAISPVDRGTDLRDLGLLFLVVDKFAKDEGQGRPPEDWTDERVEFTEDLLGVLSNPRQANLLAVDGQSRSGFWPQLSEWTTVYDADLLLEKRLFLSVITVTYREENEVEG